MRPPEPVLLVFNLDGSWEPAAREEVLRETRRLARALEGEGRRVREFPVRGEGDLETLASLDPSRWIVFNWCESIPGLTRSEAEAARRIGEAGFTYTGAAPEALEFCEDKGRVRELLERRGIPVPAGAVFTAPVRGRWDRFPAIVKALREHCSAGITAEAVVLDERELLDRVAFVVENWRQPALVEEFVDGREFRAVLWGNGPVEMLPVVEMDYADIGRLQDRLCTWEAKFVPGSFHYTAIRTLLPAPLSPGERRTLEGIAAETYRATGCRDYARIDLRLRDGVFFVLDVNPNADISADASIACAAEAAGHSYGALGSRIVGLAAVRHPVFGRR
jgi:D-alanine-D-alanine ligase